MSHPLAKITLLVTTAHIALLCILCFWTSEDKIIKESKPIVVQTVTLNPPQKQRVHDVPKARVDDSEAIPEALEPTIPEPATPAIKEPPPPAATPKPKPKPAEAIKPKVTPKPLPKPTLDKLKSAPEKPKVAPKKTPPPPAKQPPAPPKEDPRRAELLRQAASALAGVDTTKPQKSNSGTPSKGVSLPGKLKIDSLDGGISASYSDLLALRLQQLLKLPDTGSVEVSLTLDKTGKVLSAVVSKQGSQSNRDYLNMKLKNLSLPPFGKEFGQESSHTFTVLLHSD